MTRLLRYTCLSLLLCSIIAGMAQAQLSVSTAPTAGLDSLKVTLKAVNLKTDQGSEVSLLSGPTSFQLLPSGSPVVALKLGEVKPGTYLAFTAEFAEASASYRGRAVPIRLQYRLVRQEFREPIKIGEDEIVIASLLVELRQSLSQANTVGYLFTPAIKLAFEKAGRRLPPVTFSGRIWKLDAATKSLLVSKEGSLATTNVQESAVEVDASQATIVDLCGNKLDFDALAIGQQVNIAGMLGDRHLVLARLIRIERAAPTDENESAAALGTVLEINAEARSFVMLVEHLIARPELLRVASAEPVQERSFKLTVTWNERTIFFHNDARKTAADLAVGQRIGVRFPEFAPPFLAAVVRIFDERAAGIVTDNSGLPDAFLIASLDDRRLAAADAADLSSVAPVRLIKVLLSEATKIISPYDRPLTVRDILVGAKVEVQGTAAAENTIQASVVKIVLIELKGKVSPEDVDAQAMAFKLTLGEGEARVAVKVKEQTLILLETEQERPRPIRASEFFRIISARPARLEVEGTPAPDEARTIIALRIKIKE